MTTSRSSKAKDAKVPIKKPFIHKITAEAWHGYNQEIHTEKQELCKISVCKCNTYVRYSFRRSVSSEFIYTKGDILVVLG